MADKVVWDGQSLIKAMRKAEALGLWQTGSRVCITAGDTVRVDEGVLRSTIKPQTTESQKTSTGYKVEVGSDSDIAQYALAQEMGPSAGGGHSFAYTPYMRPSVDKEFLTHIGEDIKQALDDQNNA